MRKRICFLCMASIICNYSTQAMPYGYDKVENNIHFSNYNQDILDNQIYKYGEYQIIMDRFVKNLSFNVQPYLNSKNWNDYLRQEFIDAYYKYMAALKEGRLQADSFGTIFDSEGKLGSIDDSDYWYDRKGNRITGSEYRKLNKRKQKRYWTFHANREVASFFNLIAKAMIKR